MHLEIERKFLLKAIPTNKPDEVINIDQYYWKNSKGIWERVRKYESIKEKRFIHTIKKSVAKGVNIEDEKDITSEEFEKFLSKCFKEGAQSKFISKDRLIYKISDEIKWEVDVFDSGYKLIIAEVEIPKKNYKLEIPEFIKDVLLMEVTNLKQFSNRNLSINIKEIGKYNGRV